MTLERDDFWKPIRIAVNAGLVIAAALVVAVVAILFLTV